jgi:hypothetical protein
MVDGRVQRPCAGDMKAVAPVRASRRGRPGKMEAGKAPPKSRGEHASRACRLHVPFNFTVLTDASSSLPHHTHVFAPCMRGKRSEILVAVMKTSFGHMPGP